MRRMVMLLSVVALMVVMVAMSVAPAFAAWDAENGACRTGSYLSYIGNSTSEYHHKVDRNDDNYVCYSPSQNRIYDNRII